MNLRPDDERIFTTAEMADLLRVSLDDVDYWVRCKLITPNIRQASGQGSRRLFGWEDLREAFLVKRLRAAKWKPKQIGKAMRVVIAAMKNPSSLPAPLLIHEGSALLILCRSGGEMTLLDASSPGQYVMVIALDTLEEETRRQLAQSK